MTPQERLRDYIKNSGLKQKYVAETCGFSEHEFSRIMTMNKKLSLNDFQRICNALDVSADKFIAVRETA